MDAESVFQMALDTYYGISQDGRDDIDRWFPQNKASLQVALGHAKRAFDMVGPNADVYAFMSKVLFDLQDITAAEKYADLSIKMEPITFDANHIKFLIAWNIYMGRLNPDVNPRFGGSYAVSYKVTFHVTNWLMGRGDKQKLEVAAEQLRKAFLGCVRHERSTHRGAIYMAGTLIDSFSNLQVVRIHKPELLTTVVGELDRLPPSSEGVVNQTVQDMRALAYSMMS